MYSNYEALRNARNVTDYEVAKATGLNPSTLYAWRDGEYTPKVDKLIKIASFFGVTLEELLSGKEG